MHRFLFHITFMRLRMWIGESIQGACPFQDSAYCCIPTAWADVSTVPCTYIHFVSYSRGISDWIQSNWITGITCKLVWTSVVCWHLLQLHPCRVRFIWLWMQPWYVLKALCVLYNCFSRVFHHGPCLDFESASNTLNPFWSCASADTTWAIKNTIYRNK